MIEINRDDGVKVWVPVYSISYVESERTPEGRVIITLRMNNGEQFKMKNESDKICATLKTLLETYENRK